MSNYKYKWSHCVICNRRTTTHLPDGVCVCKTCIKENKEVPTISRSESNTENEVILVFGDMHIPYHREGSIEFLKAINEKYKPTKVICTGDELDNHAMSFHDSDPDALGAGDELEEAMNYLKELYKTFPNVDLVDSNHGSMVFRKAKFSGIPLKFIRSMKDIIEAPEGWNWHKDFTHKMNNGQDLFVVHGLKKNSRMLAEQYGCCVVQGHYHEDSSINYSSSPRQLIWGCSVGCLIDDKSLAMEYNKSNLKRPILSCVLITNGIPQIIPMVIKDHKWIGKV
ncbi:MAG: metallophosphoesterase [Candidatus Hodarchaeales archaeon]